ncbi:unnamed protein product [Moneuplotes crassus]|uniref:Uncharacterized protein n=1 Tax=Euplotes crassus TaxID=5936 RepID=A0AAD1U4N8_EUPCR|nr:unnamed protein product [Moneuplotes crassus]
MFLLIITLFALSYATELNLDRDLSTSSRSTCRTCVKSSSQRWCSITGNYQYYGDCCYSWDYSGYCSGSSSYVCSNSSNIGGNGGLILCPYSSSDCNSRTKTIYYTGINYTLSNTYIDSSSVCSYIVQTSNSSIKSLEIYVCKNFKVFSLVSDF